MVGSVPRHSMSPIWNVETSKGAPVSVQGDDTRNYLRKNKRTAKAKTLRTHRTGK